MFTLRSVVLSAIAFSASASCLLSQSLGGCRIFPPNNVWNVPVDSLPADTNSSLYIQTMGVQTGAHPDFGHSQTNGIPYVIVPLTQPGVSVTFRYESDGGKYPIPPNPPIEGGANSTGDRHVLILKSGSCLLYELFSAYPNSNGSWSAGSGSIFHLNSNALRPEGWTSGDAAGLPMLPGLVRYDEVASGHIDHALRFTAAATRKAHIWPARHDASSHTETRYPPMGQRFRLRQDFNVTSFSPHVQVILRALQRYGMFLADTGGPWFISGVPDTRWDDDELHTLTHVLGSDFEAVDETSLQTDQDSGQTGSK